VPVEGDDLSDLRQVMSPLIIFFFWPIFVVLVDVLRSIHVQEEYLNLPDTGGGSLGSLI